MSLESEEYKIHPVWRQLLNDQMIEGSSTCKHVMLKPNLVGPPKRARFLKGFSILVDAVGIMLPSWWPNGIIDMVKRKDPLNNDKLIVVLEEIK